MRLLLAVVAGKLVAYLSRTFHLGGGSAAPGLYALKIEPDLVEKLIRRIPRNVIITGTNGKTTTARMFAHLATHYGLKVIRNHTGSNLERGIASTLTQGVKLTHPGGVSDRHLGIWELDEAAFNSLASKIKPDIIVFLNVFRDQLDRYGEVDSVVKNWSNTLKTLPAKTVILVNGDDANTAKLASSFKRKAETFGVENYKIMGEAIEKKKSQVKLDFEAKNVKLNGLNGSSFNLSLPTTNYQLPTTLPLPGIYHIYDALAALAAAQHLGLPINQLTDHLINFSPAFGRVEKFSFPHGKWERRLQGYIFLIKNPAGATQVFETIVPQLKPQDRLLIALNDNLADGTDVSWIWDAVFEVLQKPSRAKSRDYTILASGSRAADLALRLKYAGFNPKSITAHPSLKKALLGAQKGLKGTLYILPTYTAMLELQKILVKLGVKKHYWKEE